MATHDNTLGSTAKRLAELGYAPTSARNPDRFVSRPGWRDSFFALRDHPCAVFCRPTAALGCELDFPEQRQIVLLVLTGYLLSERKQAAAVKEVLEQYGLLSGPVRIDAFENEERPLQYNGSPIFDGDAACRLAHDGDSTTVIFKHAIAPNRYVQRTDTYGRTDTRAAEPIGSHVIELSGEWKNGTLLETPRDRLPELLQADVGRIISACESARWDNRPLAMQRDAAA